MGIEQHDKKTGKIMSAKELKKQNKYKSASFQRKASARSGEVITRMVGDEKIQPPPPTQSQVLKQNHRLR